MRKLPAAVLATALLAFAVLGLAGRTTAATGGAPDPREGLLTDPASFSDAFPRGVKNLLPSELLPESMRPQSTYGKELRVAVGDVPAEAIEQPIAFPHNTHTKTLGLDCQYCHSGARKGAHAGVPSENVCMGCHKLVPRDGRPELDKLVAYYDKGEPIPWVKVHDLPDFVNFNHKRHVTAGLQCQECHGEVEEMTVDQRVASLKMGWCLDCHATHESVDANYGTQAELRRAELKDCYTCHK